ITDHTMPRMTGLQLATEISALQPNLPIILCSGYSEAVTPEEATKAGVCRFLAKPVDMRLLAIAIREILPNQDRGEQ
ncbi:MAG: response regulator, partial [Desulfobulbaceae bacterium]|nr:response regulator [Desulfobulbaceae bacterium]